MKRFTIIGLLFAGLAVLLAATVFAAARSAQAAPVPVNRLGAALNVGRLAQDPLATSQTITCTVNITTTDAIPTNQTVDTAATIANYSGLALVPSPTYPFSPGNQVQALDDWFVLGNTTPGFTYSFEATPDAGGNYNLGMEIYSSNVINSSTLYKADINTGDGNSAKIVTDFPGLGPYYIRIFQISNFCSGGTYNLRYSSTGPTSTPTPTVTPTRTPTGTPAPFACTTGADKFEPNDSLDTATTVGLGVKYDNLNFVQCIQDNGTWDNDFFKVRVKPGMLVTCRTLDLSPGTDTNLILYDVNGNGINGDDDVNRAAGDLSSSVTYFSTYEGWLYGLVGEGFHRPQSEQAAASYSYECFIGIQTTPTPAPTPTDAPGVPTRTPVPPTPTETLIPTPTLSPTPPFIRIVPLPTPTPVGLPITNIPVSLLVYYDANNNNKADPGEGVIGISARVYDLSNGKLLAQGLTDQTGRVTFTVTAPGAVQLVVAYLNFSTIILPSGGSAVIRVSASDLPGAIP
jgi:hypothetical protein